MSQVILKDLNSRQKVGKQSCCNFSITTCLAVAGKKQFDLLTFMCSVKQNASVTFKADNLCCASMFPELACTSEK